MIDIQSNSDSRGIALDWVGITNYQHPIQFENFNSIADISFYVSLDSDKRAIHMSRLVETLQDFSVCDFSAIDNILSKCLKTLESRYVHLELKFPYIIKKTSPVTKKQGNVSYTCELICEKCLNNDLDIKYRITMPITSVCPCSKEISDYGAHNQRGFVTIEFFHDIDIDIKQLIFLIEKGASSDVYSLLKRPDEKYVTENGYINAKFVEDIARDIVLLIPNNLKIRGFKVIVENMESIHMHNAISIYKSI